MATNRINIIRQTQTAETDDTLVLAPDGAGGVEFRAETGGTGMTNPMTTAADLIVGGTAGAPARLAKGSDGQVLTVDPSTHLLVWATPSTGFANPMTTTGDIIYSSSGSTPARLAVGSSTTVLHGGTTPAYSAVLPADVDVSADNTTSNATTGHHGFLPKLGGGTSNFLRADGTWAAAGGGSSPLTTKGDVWGYSSVDARIPVGSNTFVLTADSTQTLGLKWAAAAAGGTTVQYPALKPGTPTDDYAAASLDGAWSAHSSGGTFATTSCLTQGDDWVGSSIRMMFSAQMGALYRTQANGDFDVTWGGIRLRGYTSAGIMVGLTALNSSGTGIGVIIYNDGSMYFASITAWQYAGNTDSWSNFGFQNATVGAMQGDYWLRLKRVSGTWTGYASRSGRVWDKTFNTRADSITVDRIATGLFYDTGQTYFATVIADYFQQDV